MGLKTKPAKAKGRDAALDAVLSALADPQRRRVVDVLRGGAQSAGELSKIIGLSAPAMSRHLRLLKEAGVVGETHPDYDARVRIYALRPQRLSELKTWLETTEQLWADQLASFKSHVER